MRTRDAIKDDRLLSDDDLHQVSYFLAHQGRRASEAKLAVSHFDHLEGVWERSFQEMFDKQKRSTLSRFKGHRGRAMLTRAVLNVNDVFDRDHWVGVVKDEALGLYTRTAELACHRLNGGRVRSAVSSRAIAEEDLPDLPDLPDLTLNVLGKLGEVLNVQMPEVQAFIKGRANQLAGQVNDTTYQALKDALAEGVGLGETIPQLADRIQGVFDSSDLRATTIARTETISGYNGATNTLFDVYGADVAAGQEWLATNDNRTRLDHSEADGQRVAAGDQFVVGGEQCDYPGDPNLSPEQCINCRCTTLVLTPEDMGVQPATTDLTGIDAEQTTGRSVRDWSEADHPRDDHGKFGSGSGSAPALAFPATKDAAIALAVQALQGQFGEYRTLVINVRAGKIDGQPARFFIKGEVRDSANNKVGVFDRHITADGVVHNDELSLHAAAQGTGFATAFNAQAESTWAANGFSSVQLTADLDVGGYAWAVRGFDFNPNEPGARDGVSKILSGASQPYSGDNGRVTGPFAGDAKLTGMLGAMSAAVSSGTASALDVAKFGAKDYTWTDNQGRQMWPGKAAMLNSSGWMGVKALQP